MRKNIVFLSLLALLVLSPSVLAREGHGESEGNPGTSNSHSNSNNNNNSNNNGNPGENSPQNSGQTHSTNNNSNQGAPTFNIKAGQAVHFGDNNADEATTTDENFDSDADDGSSFTTTSNVTTVQGGNVSLGNGQSFSLTPSQTTFLQNSGILGANTRLQVMGNHSDNGNVVRIMKVQDPATGQMVMVRLHTNNEVNQFSVKSKGALPGFVAAIVSFFQSLFGTGGTPNPSPSPTATPTASPSPSPSVSPTPNPSESPSPSPSATP